MSEIKLNRRYPDSRLEDVTDAYMRGVEFGRAMRADENAKLREQNRYLMKGDLLHVLTDQELAEQQRREREMQASIKALDAENVKLRELVQDVMPIVCDGCHERLCKMPKEEHPFITCLFADRLFELGIEVD